MFEPLLHRLEREAAARAGSFGGSVPPFTPDQSLTIATRTPSPSLVDAALEPPHVPATANDGIAAITGELLKTLDESDEVGRTLFLAWNEFREKLTAHFRSRSETRTAFLQAEDERLTREARVVLATIGELVTERNSLYAQLNHMETFASELRAALHAVLAQNPGSLDDDDRYTLPEEIEAWQGRISMAQDAVTKQAQSMVPLQEQIAGLSTRIQSETEKLQGLRHERLQVRDELRGFDRRGPMDSGLRGRVGHSSLSI